MANKFVPQVSFCYFQVTTTFGTKDFDFIIYNGVVYSYINPRDQKSLPDGDYSTCRFQIPPYISPKVLYPAISKISGPTYNCFLQWLEKNNCAKTEAGFGNGHTGDGRYQLPTLVRLESLMSVEEAATAFDQLSVCKK